MLVERKLRELGLSVPDLEGEYRTNPSGARFVSHVPVGNMLHLAGSVPLRDGAPYLTGVLGQDLTVAQGYEAARYAALTTLSILKYALKDLDRVARTVRLVGYVNSAPGFTDQPRVVNGATDLFVELYGDRGKPTRAAIGCQGLALNSSVELILDVTFLGNEIAAPLPRDYAA